MPKPPQSGRKYGTTLNPSKNISSKISVGSQTGSQNISQNITNINTNSINQQQAQAQMQAQIQQAIQQAQQKMAQNQGGQLLSSFRTMTDQQQAAAITKGIKTDIPDFLSKSSLQRFTYAMDFKDKATVVDTATFNNTKGWGNKTFYRTVYGNYDPSTDIGYRSQDIIDQINKGDFTRYSDTGGSLYDRALYFAIDSVGASSGYAYGSDNRMMRMKIDPNANIVSYSALGSMVTQEINSGSALGKALAKAEVKSRRGIYALAKGIDGWYAGSGRKGDYFMLVNRSVMISDKDTKQVTRNTDKW